MKRNLTYTKRNGNELRVNKTARTGGFSFMGSAANQELIKKAQAAYPGASKTWIMNRALDIGLPAILDQSPNKSKIRTEKAA